MTRIRVINWNVAWQKPNSPKGSKIKKIIESLKPDIVCLTECHQNFFNEGCTILSNPDFGYVSKIDRRKVLLWSKTPFEEIDDLGEKDMPSGRFIAGSTIISNQRINLIGVCIPWRAAHVSTGKKDKKPWQDHVSYLNSLNSYLEARDLKSSILLGDFNQTIPRTRQPVEVYEQLKKIIKKFSLSFDNTLENKERQIDHIISTPDIKFLEKKTIASSFNGVILSDHNGVLADFYV